MEQRLWATETLVSDGDHLTIGKLVALLQGGGRSSGLHFLFEVERHVAQLLFDITHDLTLSGSREGVAALCQDLYRARR